MKGKFRNWLLIIVKLTGFLPAMLFYKPRIVYPEGYKGEKGSKSLKGPVMLVSNHKKLLDMPLYMMIFPFRTIRFLIAEVMYNKGALFAWFLDHIGGIKVDRKNFKFGFIAEGSKVIDEGGCLGVFPAGRLPVDGKDFPFTPSTTVIAKNTGADIVPVYTDGNYGLFKRTTVVVGDRINVRSLMDPDKEEKAELDRVTKLLEEKVFDLAKNITGKQDRQKSGTY